MEEASIQVLIREGLHARPAAYLAKLAKSFKSCRLELVSGATSADAKSTVKIMLLSIKEGDRVVLRADGDGEMAAVARLRAYLQDPDGGLEAAPAGSTASDSNAQATAAQSTSGAGRIDGVRGSPGVAMGPIHAYFPAPLQPVRQKIAAGEVPTELQRFQAALDGVVDAARRAASSPGASDEDRSIVEAVIDVARDEAFVDPILRGIEQLNDAAAITLNAGEALATSFAAATTEYLRARAEDVRSVTRQVAAALLGTPLPDLAEMRVPSVLVARDLGALEFARLPRANLLGLVCIEGSSTSHVAIMARTHGIPAVMGVRADATALTRAGRIVVDGDAGQVVIDPDDAQRADAQARIDAGAATRAALQRFRDHAPRMADGREIHVAANLGAVDEIDLAQAAGAHGVGLFRTELMFMQRGRLPTEDEQEAAYSALARAFAPDPVVIRTLDVGGDKPVAGIDFPHEDNPFLGWRGIRMCLDRPEVFKPQLRALLRAARAGNVRVMLPMVALADEVRRARAIVAECEAELLAEGVAHGSFELGIMVETPAAALQADELAAEVAFFSIGTNDLTQYVMATDRVNPRLAALYDVSHPAVIAAIRLTCEAARRAGIPVAVCGEAAADPRLVPRLIELGVTELSMSPASILAIKKQISEL